MRPRFANRSLPWHAVAGAVLAVALPVTGRAQTLTAAGEPARLEVRVTAPTAVRITLAPLSFGDTLPFNPALSHSDDGAASPSAGGEPVLHLRRLSRPVRTRAGELDVVVSPAPLTVTVTAAADGRVVQELRFEPDGSVSFRLDDAPVLGMGGGGPRPERGSPWREDPVEFDRRGRIHAMQPRWQSDMYGSRNPVAMLVGTGGWGLFVATPWVRVDLSAADRGAFLPWEPSGDGTWPQDRRNQHEQLGKGTHPRDRVVPGVFDIFVFDAVDPARLMEEFAALTGPAAIPPRWALGYMQSHRTLETDSQMVAIVDTFREKEIPLDAVIYLGTGFTPRGWNTEQPSFAFNPEVFRRDPVDVLTDLHERNVRVVVHMVPFDRDELPTLHGTIPPGPGENVDNSHIQTYWRRHEPLMEAGVDAFWPDEGDWFDLFERLKRHQMYYQGSLQTRPGIRPWHLQRNGYPGIARWGGWVWSGDTESAWRTLEAQIAVGLNYSLSIGPYWGSDIGGFYPNHELTGELYARWFQLAAFSGSFRSHGRTWWTRLPWGWGLSELGPQEVNNRNVAVTPAERRRVPLESELNNPRIEAVVKAYAELRYRLMPYTYTLAWQARSTGMPLMRALWLHYPEDERARGLGDQYLWGRDLLVAPVYRPGATTRDVYLPDGDWYDWWTDERVEGGRTVERPVDLAVMPIYVRVGAILPLDPVRQHTGEDADGPTTLRIYGGADGEFTLYDDDGTSQDYLDGVGNWTRIRWSDTERTVTLEPGAPAGAHDRGGTRVFEIVLMPDGTTRRVTYDGTTPVTFAF